MGEIIRRAPFTGLELIADCLRIDRKMLYNWFEQGKVEIAAGRADTLHARFCIEYNAARAGSEITLTEAALSKTNWKTSFILWFVRL
jgi:hypothetical protein